MTIRILPANIVTAFDFSTVGTKVTDHATFTAMLGHAVSEHDFTSDDTPGQGYIPLPAEAVAVVISGVGPRSANRDDYIVRRYRGTDAIFLRRGLAAPPASVAAIVYTRDAYLTDPDVLKDAEEQARIAGSDATHVLVAVLASAGPRPALGLERLIRNLAGGNKDALAWTADEIRKKAQESICYADDWATVGDPDGSTASADFQRAWEQSVRFRECVVAIAQDTDRTADELRSAAERFLTEIDG